MKKLLVTVFLFSFLGSFAQYSPTFDTVKLYRGGNLYKLITYSTDSVRINGVTYDMSGTRAVSYWTAITATRVNDSTFTVTGNQVGLLSRGTVLKWDNSGVKQAMIVSSAYSSVTTVSIIGDDLAAGFSSMKYGKEKARMFTLAYAGTIGATGTDVMGHWYAPFEAKIFGCDVYLGTAGKTGATEIDIIGSVQGGFFATGLPSIGSTYYHDTGVSADDGLSIEAGEHVSVDINSVCTTPGVDLYVNVFYTPAYNIHLP